MSMHIHSRNTFRGRRRSAGFTLVELMVALVLGLIVTGAALAMFLTNQRVYNTTESLGRVQENVRTAYELMARDIRESAGNPCEAGLPTVNVLNSPASNWWSSMDGSVRGYASTTAFADEAFGTAAGVRLTGTDAIELKSAVTDGVSVVSHNAAAASFKVSTINHGLSNGDVAIVCDFDHAAIFQVTNASSGTNDTIVHNTGAGTPGNCTKGLGFSAPTLCTVLGTPYTYGPNSMIARLRMERWYIANNNRGGRSLYQSLLVNNAGTLSVAKQEIADNVINMQVQYLLLGATSYVNAASVTTAQWNSANVVAVRILLTLREHANAANPNSDVFDRTLEHTVTLRNRVP
jgi:type IV pilus assembly protein PilW